MHFRMRDLGGLYEPSSQYVSACLYGRLVREGIADQGLTERPRKGG